MTLVVVLYLEQIKQKLKVFGGPFGLNEVMLRSHSRRELKVTGSERVR